MDLVFNARSVYTEPTSDGKEVYLEISGISPLNCEDIFHQIKDELDMSLFLDCVSEEEVIEHFEIEVK